MDQEARLELMVLINQLPAEDRAYIAGLPEGSILLGRFFRSGVQRQILAGEMQALAQWSRGQAAAQGVSLDDVTGPVLHAVWRTLQASHGAPSNDDG